MDVCYKVEVQKKYAVSQFVFHISIKEYAYHPPGRNGGVYGYAQHTVILFRDDPKKSLYLGVIRVGYTPHRFGYHPFDPLFRDLAFRHRKNRMFAIFQLYRSGCHIALIALGCTERSNAPIRVSCLNDNILKTQIYI